MFVILHDPLGLLINELSLALSGGDWTNYVPWALPSTVPCLIVAAFRLSFFQLYENQRVPGTLCSTDTDTRIGIGRIRIRGYVKFLQKLKAQRCIGVSDPDTRICIGYVIRGHVEVSGLYRWAACMGSRPMEGGMEVVKKEVLRDKSDFVIRMERFREWEMWQVSPQL